MNYEKYTKDELIIYIKILEKIIDSHEKLHDFRNAVSFFKDVKIDLLIHELKTTNLDLLGKKDIMRIFCCQSAKALDILRFLYGNNMATKIGKEFYVTKDNLKKFISIYMGKNIVI